MRLHYAQWQRLPFEEHETKEINSIGKHCIRKSSRNATNIDLMQFLLIKTYFYWQFGRLRLS